MTVRSYAGSPSRRGALASCALLGGLLAGCDVGTQAGPTGHHGGPVAPTPTTTVPATAAYPTTPPALPAAVRPSSTLGEYSIHVRPKEGTVTVEKIGAPGSPALPVELTASGLLPAAGCPAGFQAATTCFDVAFTHDLPRGLGHVHLQVLAITAPDTGLEIANHAGLNGDPSELGLAVDKGFWQLTSPASATPGVVAQSPFNTASRELVFADDDAAPIDVHARLLGSLAYSDYDLVASTQPFVDACDGGVALAPSPSATLALPFPFTLYGATSGEAQIGLTGVIALGDKPAVLTGSNLDLPSAAAPGSAIFPFWDDLGYGTSGGAVCARTLGSAPNRQVVITWKNLDFKAAKDAGAHLTFSAVLSEGSDTIDVVYDDMTGPTERASGASATFGVQDIGGFAAVSVFQEADFATGDAYSLIPAP
ncbi:MAG: hypothetical protein ABJE95_32355 [Byssovorax sp.]